MTDEEIESQMKPPDVGFFTMGLLLIVGGIAVLSLDHEWILPLVIGIAAIVVGICDVIAAAPYG